MVDHQDHNGLNNVRSNLRISTPTLNQINRKASSKNSSSKFLGVAKVTCKKTVKGKTYIYEYWRATIAIEKKNKFLGAYKIEEDAARAYDKAAIENYGDFANPNFK